jgi:hypothetical protein
MAIPSEFKMPIEREIGRKNMRETLERPESATKREKAPIKI